MYHLPYSAVLDTLRSIMCYRSLGDLSILGSRPFILISSVSCKVKKMTNKTYRIYLLQNVVAYCKT